MEEKAGRLVAEFLARQRLYEQLGAAVYALINSLLESHEIPVHSISYRVKNPDRLLEKLLRQGKSYSSLDEISDLLGLRVITYFADDVDRVVDLVSAEFVVDPERSVDKRRAIDPDRFGYASVHQICQLSPERTSLPEYRSFQGLYFEIQIRSILQHAWAEIEHDLGYKTTHTVPGPLRRRFSILASLLELADDEFIRLRNELIAYSRERDKEESSAQ